MAGDPIRFENQLDANSGGTVTSVTGAAPITSTGGANPQIGITPATTSDPGSMSASDKTKLDALPSALALPVSVANGGTNSTAALNNNRAMVSSGGAIVESNDGTDVQVLLGTNPPSFGDLPSGAIPNTAVTPASYPASGQISTFTVGADGRLTAAGSTTSGSALTALNASNISTGTLIAARMETVGPGAGAIAYPASLTLDVQGRVTAATAGSPPPVANTSSSVTATSTDVIADDTWTDVVGLTASLAADATYLVQAELIAFLNVSVSQGVIQARLFNQTDGVEVTDTLRTLVSSSVPGADFVQTGTINKILEMAGSPKTIKVQVQRLSGGTYSTSLINSDAAIGFSVFNSIRLQ